MLRALLVKCQFASDMDVHKLADLPHKDTETGES